MAAIFRALEAWYRRYIWWPIDPIAACTYYLHLESDNSKYTFHTNFYAAKPVASMLIFRSIILEPNKCTFYQAFQLPSLLYYSTLCTIV